MSLEIIERLSKEHAADRAVLAERVQALNAEIDDAKRRKVPGIKAAVGQARDSRLRLRSAIDAARSTFERPRTRVFHGIKVGLQKAKGKLAFASAEKVIELVRKHFPEQADVLIKTKETPAKAALQQLPASDLKKLGCTIEATGDEIVVEPISSEIDDLVDALLGRDRDSAAEAQEE